MSHRPSFRNLSNDLRPFPAPQTHHLRFTFHASHRQFQLRAESFDSGLCGCGLFERFASLRSVKPLFQLHSPQSCVLPMSPACRHYVNSTLVMTSQLPVLHIPHFAGDRSMSRRNLPELVRALASSQSVFTPTHSKEVNSDDFIDPKIVCPLSSANASLRTVSSSIVNEVAPQFNFTKVALSRSDFRKQLSPLSATFS